MLPTQILHITREGNILVCTLNNPPHNYLEPRFFEDLHISRDLMLASDVRAVVFTGQGSIFSKGADIQEIRSHQHGFDGEGLTAANALFTFIATLPKPTVAAINGTCLGGGLELSLACHVRVCSDKARFGLPELNLGLIPGLGGVQRLIRVVGEARALEMLLLSDIISAAKALEYGLVSRVFPRNDFHHRVIMFVKNMIAVPQEAIAEILRLAAASRTEDEEDMNRHVVNSFIQLARRKRGF
jgi:enoyl-CoA hydratase/carnithine racemase